MIFLTRALSLLTLSIFSAAASSHSVSSSQANIQVPMSAYEQRIALSAEMRNELTSDRVFDAKGHIEGYVRQIMLEFRLHGGLHIINTGLENKEHLINLMPRFGFSKERAFKYGGRASAKTQKKWHLKNSLRNLDFYPPKLWLLPNKEVMYYKFFPQEVLFYYEKNSFPEMGGRHFLHDTKLVEHLIKAQKGGQELIDLIAQYGLTIESGYVDKHHPSAKENFLKNWQELTGTEDIDQAVAMLQSKNLEYDHIWKKMENIKGSSNVYYTLMTSVTSSGFHSVGAESYLNLPRLALSGPKLRNGYRRYILGNGAELSKSQEAILMHAYQNSIQGSTTSTGDIYLLDNRKVAHSREAFDADGNDRSLLVAMSGIDFSRDVDEKELQDFLATEAISKAALGSPGPTDLLSDSSFDVNLQNAKSRYSTPPAQKQYQENFSMRIFDLQGRSLTEPKVLRAIRREFESYGALLIKNNGEFKDDLPPHVLDGLGFHKQEQFQWGGKKSGRTVRTSMGNGFHTVDFYPSKYALLAHNEIFYQRILPERLLFHYRKLGKMNQGGRTLVHSAKNFEKILLESTLGRQLVPKLKKHGQLIRTGFLDANHPRFGSFKARSWQDRFDTDDIEEAARLANSSPHHFDFAYILELPEKDEEGKATYMLMTEITVPMFKQDPKDGHAYMMFPRIPMTGPKLENGYREFLIGNGQDYTREETTLLLKAIWATREGFYQQPGDILLVDNIRYGHSREPYEPKDAAGKATKRVAGVIMAGEFHTDDLE